VKVGNLVKVEHSEAIGIVVDIIQKKIWRVHDNGVKVNWDNVEPEPHAVVLYSHNNGTVNIPINDLEVVDEV
tara:strand:+ start:633 stop:848 length:216 start_codon:yes stop_codon:yes gene_type:complete